MYSIPVLPSEIDRAELILGIRTKAVQLNRQRQVEIDEVLRQALLVGLEELERKRLAPPLLQLAN